MDLLPNGLSDRQFRSQTIVGAEEELLRAGNAEDGALGLTGAEERAFRFLACICWNILRRQAGIVSYAREQLEVNRQLLARIEALEQPKRRRKATE